MKLIKKMWMWIILLIILTPVGILLPEKFDAGDAWGEWSAETIGKMLGFIPEKLKQNAGLWKAPVADYNFGGEESSLTVQVISYIVSGVIGIAIIAAVMFVLKKFIIKENFKQ